MANFGPKDIKKLRETTSAGMMDCKNALKETDGDFDAAIAWLREKGLGAAAKKASKVAAEGVVSVKVSDNKAVIVEINKMKLFKPLLLKLQNTLLTMPWLMQMLLMLLPSTTWHLQTTYHFKLLLLVRT